MSDASSERVYVCALADPPNALVSNSVEVLSIRAVGEGKSPVSCTFQRSQGTSSPPKIMDYKYPIPVRPPSTLPPPGNLTLQLHLGAKVGRGRTSGVYDATIDLPNSSSELSMLAVPPLVAKISRHGREQALDNEAFLYEEMESLQGVVIPRYYGFFKGELPPGYTLVEEDDMSSQHGPVNHHNDHESTSETPRHSRSTGTGSASKRGIKEDCRGPLVHDSHSDRPKLVSIIVMEKLGEKLPIGEILPSKVDLDLFGMYSHLSRLGIDHIDIRHANILETPLCPPGWPCLVSPTTNMAYRYRLVDFDNSRKTDRPLHVFNLYYEQYVSRLLTGLPLGYVIEPWEF